MYGVCHRVANKSLWAVLLDVRCCDVEYQQPIINLTILTMQQLWTTFLVCFCLVDLDFFCLHSRGYSTDVFRAL